MSILTFQGLIAALSQFWSQQGCLIHLGHDVETGAGTFNPATFVRCLGPEPYCAAYVELSRRPKDGRYGLNPNRMQLFHQYQVVMKPSPPNIQQLYLQSLEHIGIDLKEHDIRFVHDDWEQPTLGASGLGWEVWRDGMEVTQFTYFQVVAGMELNPTTVELTYGLERLAMSLQGCDSVYDLMWNESVTYGDVMHQNEVDWSRYNFEEASVEMWHTHFQGYEAEAKRMIAQRLPAPAYDMVMKASHAFNLLDARGVISVTERTGYIERIRNLTRGVAKAYLTQREELGHPLHEREWPQGKRAIAPVKHPLPTKSDGTADFVLEIGSEELPANCIAAGMASLRTKLTKLIVDATIPFESLDIHGSPRRLTAVVKGLARSKPAERIEKRGPPVARAFDEAKGLTKAGEGFFRSLGWEGGDLPPHEIRGDYLFATVTTEAKPTAEILAPQLADLILSLDFPKRMRWGTGTISYARPLHWIVALHGDEVIPFELDGIHSGRVSQAHPQLCPGTFEIAAAADYLERLRAHKVMVDGNERKTAILEQLAKIEEESGLTALAVEILLAEVMELTEWPQLATATFDKSFLDIPSEVLISEMVHHQRYFPLANEEGRLSNEFVITADNTPTDKIRHGNVKVLSARLADGSFLYNQDLKSTLDDFNEKLKAITYRQGLGSMHDKALRTVTNTELLHHLLPIGDLAIAKRGALLCKADLSTELVNEFPDLQGVVGYHYALAHSEDSQVAQAIDEHWMPRSEHGPLPATPAGILVSLADKLDNLLSCFALGLKPTSSSDPYALRRQVLGTIKILIASEKQLDLPKALSQAYDAFCEATGTKRDPKVVEDLLNFFVNRIKTVFGDYELTKDETEASLSAGFTDIYDSFCRVQALHKFRESDPRFPKLAEVFKRAKGQLADQTVGTFDPAKLVEPAEKALATTLDTIEPQYNTALSTHDYDGAYQLIATLQQPLADLFDNVRILAEDEALKTNRIALLGRLFSLFSRLLDFSKLKLS